MQSLTNLNDHGIREGATFFYQQAVANENSVLHMDSVKFHFKGLIFFKILWTHPALKVIPEALARWFKGPISLYFF